MPSTNTTQGGEYNVLAVDDTLENLQYIMHALRDEGFKVRPASSGKLAIDGARLLKPDVILLDINMPEMNGYEVCKVFKEDPALADVPIIFVSALNEPFDKVKAFDAGGADYVTKPFQLEEVIARIRLQLRIVQLQREQEKTIGELQQALAEVKELRGLIPICANCKSVRDDEGYWKQIEVYIESHSDAAFSHGICPPCFSKLYPDYDYDELVGESRPE